ncbi:MULTISPECIES: hypothetical protein [Paraliobacillus]|uniref:hypothetical protein n=1 Tax=Paraliobacillus TaxID=200903 RepID=UPI00130067CD|nr:MULTISPECIES: hypothetical protein [Paraliobacillus]
MHNKNNKETKGKRESQYNTIPIADGDCDQESKNERHNNNARVLAAVEPEYPRINTDNL